MTRIGKSLGAVAVLLAAGAAPAVAEQNVNADAIFEQLDGNGDGGITAQELSDFRNSMFDNLDGNGDGTLTAEEIAMLQSRAAEAGLGGGNANTDRLMRRDANGDGALTRAEFAADPRAFGLIDRDKDGRITQAELAAVRDRFGGAL